MRRFVFWDVYTLVDHMAKTFSFKISRNSIRSWMVDVTSGGRPDNLSQGRATTSVRVFAAKSAVWCALCIYLLDLQMVGFGVK